MRASSAAANIDESQALCLPVSIEELLHANELGAVSDYMYILYILVLHFFTIINRD